MVSRRSTQKKWLVRALRYGLPLALVVGGIVCIFLGHGHISDVSDPSYGGNVSSGSSPFTAIPTDADSMFSAIGVSAIIVAVMVAMIGWFLRMNVEDGFDRAREEAARDYFTRTGRWPGERGPGPNAQ
jgi:hypothetical protein